MGELLLEHDIKDGPAIDGVFALSSAVFLDKDEKVRRAACEALAKLGPRGRFAAFALSQASNVDSPDLAKAAADAIRETGWFTKDDLQTFRDRLNSPYEKVQIYAKESLARHFPNDQFVPGQ
jgi:hypothetical protein